MTAPTRQRPDSALPLALARRFEAVVFDWDGTAVADRRADTTRLRTMVEAACRQGLELAIVSGTHIGNVDAQLRARPEGPGSLTLLLNRGSEVFAVDEGGPRLLARRTATATEDAALSRAAELTVERLALQGLETRIVSQRLNRRKIDLIPEPEWAEPPKSRIGQLVGAVQKRLTAVGVDGLAAALEIARAAAADAGVADARITSDAKHIEIGLTDKSDSASWIAEELWSRGISPRQVLIAGDEFGPLGGVPGSDSNLLVAGATAFSVGVEPTGVPVGVTFIGGGPFTFVSVLEDQISRRLEGEVPVAARDDGWTLEIEGADPLLERAHESLLTLADGRVGTRGSVLVPGTTGDPAVLIAGTYAGHGPECRLLNGPRWSSLALDLGDDVGVRRTLDLHAGILHQRIEAEAADVDALMLSSLARPGTALLRARATGGPRPAPVPLIGPHDAATANEVGDGSSWMRVDEPPGSVVAAAHEHRCDQADGRVESSWRLDRIACIEGSSDACADEAVVLARLGQARAAGVERLLGEHRRAWGACWADADVALDGDPDLQLAIRFAMFHMLASAGADGEAAVGARGLSGGAYHGHVFWDSDVYVLPFLAAARPRAARAMVEYRVRRLPSALRAARALGRAGARFPWESAASGDDVTPVQVRSRSGELEPVLTGSLEEHIVADVAWGAACYVDWTADRAFAHGPGLELMVQTARYWASRIELDPAGVGHIRDVMGPDEYHDHVDDNAYTNAMARWNLRRAAAMAGTSVSDEERRRWSALSDAIADGYDAGTGVYEQFAGFHDLESVLISDLAPTRPISADLLLGHEHVRRAQVVKQADVLMLHYLIPDDVAPGSLGPNLDFYEPRTAHGSSLSPGVHATLFARARRIQAALQMLRLTARIDLDDIGDMTAGGLHLAAMGGLWRAFTLGFLGVRPKDGRLAIDPVRELPWDRLECRLRFRESRVRLRAENGTLVASADPPVDAVLPGGDQVELGASDKRFSIRDLEETVTP